MHCGSCSILIKEALEDLNGVDKVEASHEHGTVSVDFDDKKITENEIKKAIIEEGYTPQ